MLYFILNDRGTAYGSEWICPYRRGLRSMYPFMAAKKRATDSTGIINYITFLEYEVYNQGVITLDNVYIGFNTDADIGYAMDDYMGTHVDANAIYFVNGDSDRCPRCKSARRSIRSRFSGAIHPVFGRPGSPSGMEAYPMAGSMHYANSSGATGDPNSPQNIYNILRTYWNNGSKMMYGGSAFRWSWRYFR